MADLTRKTANLLDYKVLFSNSFVKETASFKYYRITVTANKQYTLKSNAPASVENAITTFLYGRSDTMSTANDGLYTDVAKTITSTDDGYVYIAVRKAGTSTAIPAVTETDFDNGTYTIMLNEGSTALPYEPYGWLHSLRKLTTATEAVENPLYSDGTAIMAYTIKGNTVQNGTPTPSNPVMPQGTGNKTANLIDYSFVASTQFVTVTPITNGLNLTGTYYAEINITLEVGTTYYMSWVENVISGSAYITWRLQYTDNTYSALTRPNVALTPEKEIAKVLLYVNSSGIQASVDVTNLMLSTASLPYEPYGYKIPISSGGTTTPVYLTEQLMKINDTADSLVSTGTVTYSIKKYVFTGDETFSEYGQSSQNDAYRFATSTAVASDISSSLASSSICTHFTYNANWNNIGFSINNGIVYITTDTAIDATSLKQWLSAQYAAGTPLTIYYILATAETEQVTAPSIPTTQGANSITVDTTVQPSEFTATWTGWHDASVKEKSENLIPTNISDWEQGGISSTDGTDTVSTIRLRTIDFYPINNNTDYYISVNDTDYCYVNIILYDSSKQYAGQYYLVDSAINGATALAINVPSSAIANVAYYRAVAKKRDDSTITAQEITDIKPMLNLGSTAQTYEPYWK